MNVMIYNKYKDLLMGLNIDVMKSLEGVYNVDEIIDTFTNFYYDKMILDITAIRDYQNTDNLQKLAMNINMENVILLLDDNPETDTKTYLSKLISLGIYNFTKNVDGINYLLVHPHTYRDVVNINNLTELDGKMATATSMPTQAPIQEIEEVDLTPTPAPELAPDPMEARIKSTFMPDIPMAPMPAPSTGNNRVKIIGFKNVTPHAGATSLIYMIKKQLGSARRCVALELNRVDFLYFNEPGMMSTTSADIFKDVMKNQDNDIILLDLNDYNDLEICTDVIYLIEPSTIMINKMMRKNKTILETLRNEKVVLNKSALNSEDVATFEYETRLKVFFAIPNVDDRQVVIGPIKNFVNKLNL